MQGGGGRPSLGPHVPYRDSKLTRLLQNALGGDSRTALVVNCSPSSLSASETLSTLRFGRRAKRIKTTAKVHRERTPEELRRHVKKLEALLSRYRRGGGPGDPDSGDTGVGAGSAGIAAKAADLAAQAAAQVAAADLAAAVARAESADAEVAALRLKVKALEEQVADLKKFALELATDTDKADNGEAGEGKRAEGSEGGVGGDGDNGDGDGDGGGCGALSRRRPRVSSQGSSAAAYEAWATQLEREFDARQGEVDALRASVATLKAELAARAAAADEARAVTATAAREAARRFGITETGLRDDALAAVARALTAEEEARAARGRERHAQQALAALRKAQGGPGARGASQGASSAGDESPRAKARFKKAIRGGPVAAFSDSSCVFCNVTQVRRFSRWFDAHHRHARAVGARLTNVERRFLKAARRGERAKLEECVAAGVDVNCRDKDGTTAVHQARFVLLYPTLSCQKQDNTRLPVFRVENRPSRYWPISLDYTILFCSFF